MKREFSAGGIVFDDKGQVLLIHNAAMRDPKKSYWGFPKGHIDKGESSQAAALREVEEETGLKVEIMHKIGDSKYVFSHNGEKIFKVVVMFLMKYVSGVIKYQSEELIDAGWFSPKAALGKLSFQKDKELLQESLQML